MITGFGFCVSTQRLHTERLLIGMKCLGKCLDLKISTQDDKNCRRRYLITRTQNQILIGDKIGLQEYWRIFTFSIACITVECIRWFECKNGTIYNTHGRGEKSISHFGHKIGRNET